MSELATLLGRDEFAGRHLGSDEAEQREMLAALGVESLDALIGQVVPAGIRLREPLALGEPMTELHALAELSTHAVTNDVWRNFIGMGYYGTHTPAVIQRNVFENPGWYTAYTPYQAEISQGRLEALLNFQQMVVDLSGLPVANASLLDEATAAAEAMAMIRRLAKSKANAFFVDAAVHPQVIAVMRTRAKWLGIELVVAPADEMDASRVFGAHFQYPDTYGRIRDWGAPVSAVHGAGGLVSMGTDLLALMLIRSPGAYGADIAIGSAQRFGVPLGYGGPHAAFMACRDEHKRAMPGRIIGVSRDAAGRAALRMALQTREQHIRREKATSNICTAQVLLAVVAGMYAVYHGPDGLKKIAERVHGLAAVLAEAVRRLGFKVVHPAFFDTIVVEGEEAKIKEALAGARRRRINLRALSATRVAIALDETTTLDDVADVASAFAVGKALPFQLTDLAATAKRAIPDSFARTSRYLTHPVFHRHRSETEMLRYLKQLEDRDLSLTSAMIPLGSCTMKLNATTEMLPVTWPEFGRIHPFAPRDQTQGYQELFAQLEGWLAEITGFARVSLQPNAGSQGEYAGLLVIRAFHHSRGDDRRTTCLIPMSAHGTNPASAVMAGLEVVVVRSDARGNIDVEDLRSKARQHKDTLACLMVTYPSTHGVFESSIREICQIVHENGGQVYMDGANMNAQVGLCRPGDFGADVCHLNLHKTFCIPHGGGGPGMGPIGVAGHLGPFLPGHPVISVSGPDSCGTISAAPWGSASILAISWAYIALMGQDGLPEATKIAILNANYIARRLKGHFDLLYSGKNGLVAHECIIDTRPFKGSAGIEVEDIAKRIIDYGFHPPTVSFPVPGTLMIEPTESEPKEELDRFCDALIAIRQEIRDIEEGRVGREDNVLTRAPHTLVQVIADKWDRPYPREQAAFPSAATREHKVWPTVSRIDGAYGDRNLVCTCPPMEAYGSGPEG